ncbi:ergothioneine biosynthesis glutamate--cysteine ligase EgtA [Microtetraspora sp. AC03309]|uniref:glutamate-cysteine ligase family protein n=1 Tax=Microtetraspora sp. AC03309 TaxID=2779376 RepID=UPI001E45CC38|nr:glutamate-cysteine ligase family protein [Microtetraspora sp. AC03309]MCC5580850.1 ergothioneine biosynthesis glutamate--cysteine ligase EgtA [Microtetraspora sp. AC03309]
MTDVQAFARGCFQRTETDRVGVELEFLVFDAETPSRQVPIARIADALPPLPGGSRVTFEPGGQLELATPPLPLSQAVAGLVSDLDAVRLSLSGAGLVLGGFALDPFRPPRRQLRLPRYDAMAAFLGVPYGRLMMCSTASIQVNLDFGANPRVRWDRAHLLGPVLVAAFANSPRDGWMSGRQAVWHHLDRTRTAPVAMGGDPVEEWAGYLLDARLMLVRNRAGDGAAGCRVVLDGSPYREFARVAGRPPTDEDLAYHATTLFPPVRPRGWMETRYLDAQALDDWPVCVAVVHALVTDDRAGDVALDAAWPVRGAWARAARFGLAEPHLRRTAETCFRAAVEALPRLGAEPWLVDRVGRFAARHIEPGRSPALDLETCV